MTVDATVVRDATPADQDAIHALYMSVFPDDERSLVARLAIDLLSQHTKPATISLVALVTDKVVGHIALSPLSLSASDEADAWQAYILSPLAVACAHQRQRIGSQLIKDGQSRLRNLAVDALFVYGDPAYYGRFGFTAQAAQAYEPPYKLEHPFGWLALSLSETTIKMQGGQLACTAALSDPALW